ncbi:RING-type E3 ubiquitin transferase [Heracleum sosnowskyi]|uniref:RING-type E3 ubiquitin transferase n=1 Tax=Heracleum sosnowskyi TaxID=360622 RepID=A0AAD8M9Y3_9APIA|nr:RING-type E3 ubiquitin transferase [Heracleum sosnowskyi]
MAGDQNSSSQPWVYSQLENNQFELHGKALLFMVLGALAFLVFVILFMLFFVCRNSRATAMGEDAARDLIYKQLPVVFYGDLKKEMSAVECCICLGVFEEQDRVKVLPQCGHCFHSHCVDKWLSTRASCPLCRAALRVDSLV